MVSVTKQSDVRCNIPAKRDTRSACLQGVSSTYSRYTRDPLTSWTAFDQLLLVQIFQEFRGGSCMVVSHNLKDSGLTDLL